MHFPHSVQGAIEGSTIGVPAPIKGSVALTMMRCGHAFSHRSQRVHRARNVGSRGAPGGRKKVNGMRARPSLLAMTPGKREPRRLFAASTPPSMNKSLRKKTPRSIRSAMVSYHTTGNALPCHVGWSRARRRRASLHQKRKTKRTNGGQQKDAVYPTSLFTFHYPSKGSFAGYARSWPSSSRNEPRLERLWRRLRRRFLGWTTARPEWG